MLNGIQVLLGFEDTKSFPLKNENENSKVNKKSKAKNYTRNITTTNELSTMATHLPFGLLIASTTVDHMVTIESADAMTTNGKNQR